VRDPTGKLSGANTAIISMFVAIIAVIPMRTDEGAGRLRRTYQAPAVVTSPRQARMVKVSLKTAPTAVAFRDLS